MERECPKCVMTGLARKTIRGVTVDECPSCGGRWYDLGELAKLVKDRAAFDRAMAAGPIKPRPGRRDCPCCGKDMVNAGLGSEFLRADLCPSCRGLWLDGNELHLVDKIVS